MRTRSLRIGEEAAQQEKGQSFASSSERCAGYDRKPNELTSLTKSCHLERTSRILSRRVQKAFPPTGSVTYQALSKVLMCRSKHTSSCILKCNTDYCSFI